MKCTLIFLMMLIGSQNVRAVEISYEVSKQRPATEMLKFSVPYTFGIHDGQARVLEGTVVTDEMDKVVQARFKVPIESMSTGNDQRDCHMRESMGIDYAHSQFPAEHICNDNNQLPPSGPDSVRFPYVLVEFQNMTLPKDAFTIGLPQITDVSIKMHIHGVQKIYNAEKVIITKILNPNGAAGFRIVTKLPVSLKDYGIQIKALKIGPVSVKVKDLVTVAVDIDVIKK
jgi:polyisoprenoid-binding protein YceI